MTQDRAATDTAWAGKVKRQGAAFYCVASSKFLDLSEHWHPHARQEGAGTDHLRLSIETRDSLQGQQDTGRQTGS